MRGTQFFAGLQKGFTLLEVVFSAAIFTVIAGAAFSLLNLSQQRYQTDSQVLTSFQEARMGVDQIIRDTSDAGYPPPNQFSVLPKNPNQYAATPIAWSPGYSGLGTAPSDSPCSLGVACTTPSGFDLIIETTTPETAPVVQWIRYQLPAGTSTLLRGMAPKTSGGGDPLAATAAKMQPLVQNVMNGSKGIPIFSNYFCDSPTLGITVPCNQAGSGNVPQNIRDFDVELIVQTTSPDVQTEQVRSTEIHGRAHRLNPTPNAAP